jgi:hypothetical protein
MNDNTVSQAIDKKALSVKQLELNLARLQKEHQKAKDKLTKQIEKVKESEQKSIARKQRNKRIYDWGGLLPSTLGVTLFDSISDNPDLKNVLRGLLLKLQHELDTNGFGLTTDNKQTWLEFYKQSGKKFIETQKIETSKLSSINNSVSTNSQ